jgi:DNA-binding CsgD family transcriptional regulator
MNDLDTKIENALKDENIIKIMNKASKRFRNQLNSDSIYSCQLNALWKTFLNHDETKGAKFTTYLYKGVFIECMKEIKFTSKFKNSNKLHDNIPNNKDYFLRIDMLDELETDEEKELFLDRLSNMTISEIAEKNNKNRETIRKKINKLTEKIKNKFL